MEPYQYWTIAGFIFLFFELMTLRTLPLVLAGSAFFAAVIAFKYPEAYYMQALTCFVFVPVLLMAVKPYIKNKFKKGQKNEHK
ncbi:MAG: hypothetical protein Q4F80_02515 [bacterium]|nr:hypothetical protein [bacterium]